jgi:signal peptidase I
MTGKQAMGSPRTKPDLVNGSASELLLSGSDLVELLRELLAKGKLVKFRAKGFSMTPFIKDGDVVAVSPLSGRRPGLGDVAVFTHPRTKKLIVHRIVGKSGATYLARGDSNSQTDGWVPGENLLGRVTGVERDGKAVSLGLGPERFLLALLTRFGLLKPLIQPAWKLLRPLVGRGRM